MPTINHIKTALQNSLVPRHWWQAWLLHLLGKPASFLITEGDFVVDEPSYERFLAGVARMQAGEPLAYLLGYQAFWKFDFKVNQYTLVPRPDTERLVQAVLDYLGNTKILAPAILDLGTGSGCIAISLAKEIPRADVLAVDVSAQALSVAQENANHLQADNCTFVQSSWFEHITGKFDIIVSNPPYIDKADEHLPKLAAEPITALVADNGGLADIECIVAQAPAYLAKQGLLAIEHGYHQGEKVRELFERVGLQQVQTLQDYGGNDRVTVGVLSD